MNSREQQMNELIRQRARSKQKYFKKAYITVAAASKMLNHAVFGQPQ